MDQKMKLKWQGRWDQVTGQAKKTWGQLTDDDLKVAEGDFEALAGKIKERTGETAEAIQERFDSVFSDDKDENS
ncbi:MAG TPA: CsbD family protein [Acidimicrobiia bacterium]|nr:CsbD family protein [Acidimicrobiia bacterium]